MVVDEGGRTRVHDLLVVLVQHVSHTNFAGGDELDKLAGDSLSESNGINVVAFFLTSLPRRQDRKVAASNCAEIDSSLNKATPKAIALP